MITRLQVIHHARLWLRTPYMHQGRERGRAADCLFPLCVAEELGILDKFGVPLKGSDYLDYPPQPKDGFVLAEALRRLIHKSAREVKPGDLVVTRYGAPQPSHCAIVADFRSPHYKTLTLIHCDGKSIVECGLSAGWRNRIVAAFEFPGIH